ncbi:hypothetical protein [Sphingobium sp. EM0848]|uniref:hypothetical protein n=1 Tax=Sphingobium sp. EM0848 TaxID=2743473 RepID=UPI00159C6E04|nr:hypothetical protein [Sphingobium sp. EM0848]
MKGKTLDIVALLAGPLAGRWERKPELRRCRFAQPSPAGDGTSATRCGRGARLAISWLYGWNVSNCFSAAE